MVKLEHVLCLQLLNYKLALRIKAITFALCSIQNFEILTIVSNNIVTFNAAFAPSKARRCMTANL